MTGGSDNKESACNAGDQGLILGSRRSPEEWNSYPLQYSGLENSMDYTVHGVAKSWTRLSNFHFAGLDAQVTLFLKITPIAQGEYLLYKSWGPSLKPEGGEL